MMKAIKGYTGLFRQPFSDARLYGDTIYVISDEIHQEICVILLSPGFYRDTYRILSNPTYQKIRLFVPSIDSMWISDIFRLIADLRKIKLNVELYYPTDLKLDITNMLVTTACHKASVFISDVIDLKIKYGVARMVDRHTIYDIVIICEGKKEIFTLYMEDAVLSRYMTSNIDYLHIPYNCSYYGGLTGMEAAKLCTKGQKMKLIMNNFKCREEFIEATTCGEYGKPERLMS